MAVEWVSPEWMGHIQLGSVTQGFAREMIQSESDEVAFIGDLGALLNGAAHASAGEALSLTLAFNDSVGGAATGFRQGLGEQGVLVAR